MALSIAARIICGMTMSASAMSAAEIMHTANSALLPFRKLHISLKLLCFSVFFSVSIKVLKKYNTI